MIKGGIEISSTFTCTRYYFRCNWIQHVFRKAAAGMIKPETLPPTEGAAAQHSLSAYLQTWDWMLLQSMSLDPSGYGWTVGVHGDEPVPTLDPMAPEELLQFTSCNYKGDCSNLRCSCKKNDVSVSQHAKLQRHYMQELY